MTLYEDTKKSYYDILKRKLNEGNGAFTVLISKGRCYSGNRSKGHQRVLWNFQEFVKSQNKVLTVNGNIIPIDESIFNNFPQKRPPMCVKQGTTGSWDRGSNPGEWTRKWYWGEKQSDYNRIKSEIDKKLKVIKQNEDKKIQVQEEQIKKSKQVAGVAVIGIIGYLVFRK